MGWWRWGNAGDAFPESIANDIHVRVGTVGVLFKRIWNTVFCMSALEMEIACM